MLMVKKLEHDSLRVDKNDMAKSPVGQATFVCLMPCSNASI